MHPYEIPRALLTRICAVVLSEGAAATARRRDGHVANAWVPKLRADRVNRPLKQALEARFRLRKARAAAALCCIRLATVVLNGCNGCTVISGTRGSPVHASRARACVQLKTTHRNRVTTRALHRYCACLTPSSSSFKYLRRDATGIVSCSLLRSRSASISLISRAISCVWRKHDNHVLVRGKLLVWQRRDRSRG